MEINELSQDIEKLKTVARNQQTALKELTSEIQAVVSRQKPFKPERESTTIDKLAAALANAQGDFENAIRSKMTATQGRPRYPFATLGDMRNATKKALKENELSISFSMDVRDNDNEYIVCTLRHSSGQWTSSTMCLIPDESGSKSPIQARGSAITYLKRYMYATMLCINDEDTEGGDDESTVIVDAKPRIDNQPKSMYATQPIKKNPF
jgi:hypothetical protein